MRKRRTATDKDKANMRAWYRANREEALEYARQYREKNRVKILAWQKEYNEDHKEEMRRRSKNWNIKLKLTVLSHYSDGQPKCAHCGEQDIIVLCIDHVNGGGQAHRRSIGISSGSAFYGWLKKNKYPEGFQVLCYNCNQRKRWKQQEYGGTE